MKKIIFLILFFPLFYSCGNSRQSSDLLQLKKENEELKSSSAIKDSTIKHFVRSFNQIMCNLDSISEKEKAISMKMKARKKMQKEEKSKLMEDVNVINSLIEQNKNIASSMQVDFSSAKLNFTEFNTMLKKMQSQIEEKNTEINSLKQNLGDADMAYNTFDFTVDQLTNLNVDMEKKGKEQQTVIEKLQQQMNTAWYIFGTYKELKSAGVVEKSGLTRIENPIRNFNTSKFIKIDLRETKSIDVWSPSFRLITNHPPDSYKTVKNSLVITNPDEFWKFSKYLVVLKE